MNSQEAQQAQAIAEIKDRHEYEEAQIFRHGVQEDDKFNDIATLLEIVDSQVQTIAADKKAMEIAADLLGVKEHKISESAKVIAELEKDIVRLVSIIDDLQARAQPENAKPCKNPPDKVYRLLVPGGDLWQEGDEVWSDREGWMHYLDYYGGVLYYNRKTMHGEIMRHVSSPVRRAESRAPRQYTEQELREWFENRPLVQDEIDALLHEVVPGENEAWYSVLKFAAHVGALKAEPDKETKG